MKSEVNNVLNKNRVKAVTVTVIIMLLAFFCVLLTACSVVPDGNQQEEGVAEPDIIKVTDDGHIIKLQHDGMTVVKAADDGTLTLVKSKKAGRYQTPIDLISYDKYMIAIAGAGEYFTEVSFYDMHELNDGTNRIEPLRTTYFFGNYFSCRIYDGRLYFLANSSSTYLKYNESTEKLEETGAEDSVFDSVEGVKKFNPINPKKAEGGGFLLASLDLKDGVDGGYILSSYRASSVVDMYFSEHGIYLILNHTEQKGCNTDYFYSITRISVDSLTVESETVRIEGGLSSRYCLYDDGEYLFAVAFEGQTVLRVFNRKMESAAYLGEIAPGEELKSVYYEKGFCYVVTFQRVDPLFKIDISNPLLPRILGYEKIEGYSATTVGFGDGFLLGFGYDGSYVQVSYFDITEDDPYEINTLKLSATAYGANIARREICVLPEKKLAGFCSDLGAYMFGVDIYGYLEQKTFLPMIISEKPEHKDVRVMFFKIRRLVVIGNHIYTISDGLVASYSLDDFSLVSQIDTIVDVDALLEHNDNVE